MHKLNVQEKYYNLLKSEEKSVELRLFDDKRKLIEVGNIIVFCNNSNKDDTFEAEVTELYSAKNFDSLCNIITPKQAGFSTKKELLEVLEEFYTVDKQRKYGVLGIEIKLI